MIQQLVVDIFRDVVEQMKCNKGLMLYLSKQTNGDINTINYEHGHYAEIAKTLIEMNDSIEHYNKKYPLIALIEDNRYIERNRLIEVNPTVLICYKSVDTFRSKDRHRDVINPILMPIYEELKKGLINSGKIANYTINHEMYTRPYYGQGVQGDGGIQRNDANIFSDILDSIELRNMNLKLYEDSCKVYSAK